MELAGIPQPAVVAGCRSLWNVASDIVGASKTICPLLDVGPDAHVVEHRALGSGIGKFQHAAFEDGLAGVGVGAAERQNGPEPTLVRPPPPPPSSRATPMPMLWPLVSKVSAATLDVDTIRAGTSPTRDPGGIVGRVGSKGTAVEIKRSNAARRVSDVKRIGDDRAAVANS